LDDLPIGYLIILVIFLFLSAFFSGAETALTSLGKLKVKELMQKGEKWKKTIAIWIEDPNKILTTILIANNVVNIGAASLATALCIEIFKSKGIGIAWGVTTFLILEFGEITPKIFARQHAEKLSLLVIKPLRVLSFFLSPLIKALVFLTNLFLKPLGGEMKKESSFITEEEIRGLISAGEKEGVLEEGEREMLHSIFEFGDTRVSEVMIPRVDMVAIEEGITLDLLLNLIKEKRHSRIPVYREDIDEIVGIFYVKDLLGLWREDQEIKVKDLMRSPYFVPELKKVSDLLHEFQKKKVHMAIVVDEYGGVSGLVTLEDLLEEIVGEIRDEYDVEEILYKRLEDGSILVNAKMDIGEANKKLKINIPEDDDPETVGGFILDLLGRVPRRGEEVEYKNLKIIIVEANEHSLSKLKIKKVKESDKKE
jgi:CBS domain containing-hemolysin-like protein